MLRYLQYLMAANGWGQVLSAEEIMRAIHEPLVVGFDSHIYRHSHTRTADLPGYRRDAQVAEIDEKHDPYEIQISNKT